MDLRRLLAPADPGAAPSTSTTAAGAAATSAPTLAPGTTCPTGKVNAGVGPIVAERVSSSSPYWSVKASGTVTNATTAPITGASIQLQLVDATGQDVDPVVLGPAAGGVPVGKGAPVSGAGLVESATEPKSGVATAHWSWTGDLVGCPPTA